MTRKRPAKGGRRSPLRRPRVCIRAGLRQGAADEGQIQDADFLGRLLGGPGQLICHQCGGPVRGTVQLFAWSPFYQQQQLVGVARAHVDGQATFNGVPVFHAADAGQATFGLDSNLGINAFNLELFNQPPAAQAKGRQRQAGEQCRKQRQAQPKGFDHANLRKR